MSDQEEIYFYNYSDIKLAFNNLLMKSFVTLIKSLGDCYPFCNYLSESSPHEIFPIISMPILIAILIYSTKSIE